MGSLVKTVFGVGTANLAASYTVTNTDGYSAINITAPSTTGITVTLPAASTNSGRQLTVRKLDALDSLLTVATTGGDTIDGQSTIVMNWQYQSLTVASNGSTWSIVSYPRLFSGYSANAAGGSTNYAEQSVASAVVKAKGTYKVTIKAEVYSGVTNGDAAGISLKIKTGSATYASAAQQGILGAAQAVCLGSANHGVDMCMTEWIGQLNSGDTVHFGLSATQLVGTAAHGGWENATLTVTQVAPY